MDILPDVMNIIISMLRPIDLLSLSYVGKNYQPYKPDFHQLICDRLKKFTNVHPEDFLKAIEQSNGFITGSFILQVLYDEEWYTDIDIFIPDNRSDQILLGDKFEQLLKYNRYKLESFSALFYIQ